MVLCTLIDLSNKERHSEDIHILQECISDMPKVCVVSCLINTVRGIMCGPDIRFSKSSLMSWRSFYYREFVLLL